MKTRALLALVSLLIVPGSALANLTPEQISVLNSARHHYKIEVLETGEPEHVQTVVLVGEVHTVTSEVAASGKQLIDAFKLIGIEGVDLSASKVSHSDLKLLYVVGSILDRQDKSRGFELGPIGQINRHEQGRLNHISEVEKGIFQLVQSYEVNPDSTQENFPTSLIGFMPPEARRVFNQMGFADNEWMNPETIKEFMARVRKYFYPDFEVVQLESLDPVPREIITASNRMHWLAVGVRGVIGSVAGLAVSAGIQYFAPPALTSCVATACALVAGTAYTYMEGSLDPILPAEAHIQDALVTDQSPVVVERNRIMSKNIHKGLLIRPHAENMLVFVGRAHVSGMVDLLTTNYGYRRVSLELLP